MKLVGIFIKLLLFISILLWCTDPCKTETSNSSCGECVLQSACICCDLPNDLSCNVAGLSWENMHGCLIEFFA